MHIFKIVCWLLFILAWLALCIAKYNKWRKRIKNCTREVSVKVVDVLEKRTARGGMVYKPIFESIDDTLELLVNPDGHCMYYPNTRVINWGEQTNERKNKYSSRYYNNHSGCDRYYHNVYGCGR